LNEAAAEKWVSTVPLFWALALMIGLKAKAAAKAAAPRSRPRGQARNGD
jgi:hypothetical protein